MDFFKIINFCFLIFLLLGIQNKSFAAEGIEGRSVEKPPEQKPNDENPPRVHVHDPGIITHGPDEPRTISQNPDPHVNPDNPPPPPTVDPSIFVHAQPPVAGLPIDDQGKVTPAQTNVAQNVLGSLLPSSLPLPFEGDDHQKLPLITKMVDRTLKKIEQLARSSLQTHESMTVVMESGARLLAALKTFKKEAGEQGLKDLKVEDRIKAVELLLYDALNTRQLEMTNRVLEVWAEFNKTNPTTMTSEFKEKVMRLIGQPLSGPIAEKEPFKKFNDFLKGVKSSLENSDFTEAEKVFYKVVMAYQRDCLKIKEADKEKKPVITVLSTEKVFKTLSDQLKRQSEYQKQLNESFAKMPLKKLKMLNKLIKIGNDMEALKHVFDLKKQQGSKEVMLDLLIRSLEAQEKDFEALEKEYNTLYPKPS